jgi:hypothetical protein
VRRRNCPFFSLPFCFPTIFPSPITLNFLTFSSLSPLLPPVRQVVKEGFFPNDFCPCHFP